MFFCVYLTLFCLQTKEVGKSSISYQLEPLGQWKRGTENAEDAFLLFLQNFEMYYAGGKVIKTFLSHTES